MSFIYRTITPVALFAFMLVSGGVVHAQAGGTKATIYRTFSESHLDRVLNKMNANYRKERSKTGNPEHIYILTTSNNKTMTLVVMKQGRVLWAMGIFPEISLTALNDWNKRAATSRALRSVNRTTGKVTAVVEWQLDAGGGVTEQQIEGFITEMSRVVDNFSRHVDDNRKKNN